MQGATKKDAEVRASKGSPWPELVKFHPEAWHCMHPDFLRHELALSRARLQARVSCMCVCVCVCVCVY
jgi:uncharacterized protein